MSGIFKAYDIRGVYPNEINADIAYAIGRAYITFSGAKKLLSAEICVRILNSFLKASPAV